MDIGLLLLDSCTGQSEETSLHKALIHILGGSFSLVRTAQPSNITV